VPRKQVTRYLFFTAYNMVCRLNSANKPKKKGKQMVASFYVG